MKRERETERAYERKCACVLERGSISVCVLEGEKVCVCAREREYTCVCVLKRENKFVCVLKSERFLSWFCHILHAMRSVMLERFSRMAQKSIFFPLYITLSHTKYTHSLAFTLSHSRTPAVIFISAHYHHADYSNLMSCTIVFLILDGFLRYE